jgi:hypothetical protein
MGVVLKKTRGRSRKMQTRCSGLFSAVRLGAALAFCGLFILLGCSSDPRGKYYPVEGKITLEDGKPVPPGSANFLPIQDDPNAPVFPASMGPIREGGSYTLSTKGKPGAPAGKYRVFLSSSGDKMAWSQVPRKYTGQKTSPLEVEVVADKPPGGYDLKLEPRSGQRR